MEKVAMTEDEDNTLKPDLETGSGCLAGERVAFTGTLASMTHRQAHRLVEEHGGIATAHVSRQTTMFVIGEEGWPLEADGKPSRKLEQVNEWQNQGIEIRLLNESDWLHLLGLQERRQEVHRLYTPAMLSQLLDLPVGVIRGWERLGLIRPVRKVYRLPYFDFQEVSGARRITELLKAGVTRKELETSLNALRHVLPNVERPLAQLELLAQDARLLYRDELGLIHPHSGQRFFDFDPPAIEKESPEATVGEIDSPEVLSTSDLRVHWTADDWFQEGCRLLETNEPSPAIEAFRLALMEKPGEEEINFHLAEALYRSGNLRGALERYYTVVEADHNFLEAWTQLGCVHAESGQLTSALEAFEIALDVHADYPDAHWQKADVLCQLGRSNEALDHWKAYLKFDSRGPWADQARQRLEEAGVEEPSLNC